jgi:hypothetical protein|tara:strand:- start:7014 stop:7430 length:417 start_codon:yes stop_codon:yes gene_type:complete
MIAELSEQVPPKVYAVMVKYSQGMNWKEACEKVGIDVRTVRKWRETPEIKKFYSDLVKDAVNEGKNKLFNAFPKIADKLIETALSKKVKPYSSNQACEIILRYLTNQETNIEMRERLESMSEQLAALEGTRIIPAEID